MPNQPSQEVIDAVEASVASIIRRVEIYESDATTLWNPDIENDPEFKRLVDGTVSVDGTRDERRTLDLTLQNSDNLLVLNSDDGLWYDKIIKVYRGITYPTEGLTPRIALIEVIGTGNATQQLVAYFKTIGFPKIDILSNVTSFAQVADYDVILVCSYSSVTTKANVLKTAFLSGKAVITIGNRNSETEIPFYTTAAYDGIVRNWSITPRGFDTPLEGDWTQQTSKHKDGSNATGGGTKPSVLTSGAIGVSTDPTGFYTATVATNSSGGRWFDFHVPDIWGSQAKILLAKGVRWVWNPPAQRVWETQIGEFCIDGLNSDDFPFQVKITGRDYTKKMLNSKLSNAVTFVSGTTLNTLVTALAANAGITKFRLADMKESITSDLSFDRGTDRWSIIRDAVNSFNYEIFFDAQGYLVTRQYLDPTLSPVVQTFQTGKQGNLAKFSRATNDTRLFNHVAVYGDPADGDEESLPYFAEVTNEDLTSPTCINRIGDRYTSFASTFFTSDQQCYEYALSLLKLNALETYEISWDSIYYPWLEANDIAQFIDPKAGPNDPDRYLMDTLTLGLGLGPMSATGKRVIFVGDDN